LRYLLKFRILSHNLSVYNLKNMGKKNISNDTAGTGKGESRVASINPSDEFTRLKSRIKRLEKENQKFRKNQKKFNDIEKALSESEEKYKTLLKSSKNVIMIVHKGVIVFSNLSGLRALGYSHINELKGKNFYDILDPMNFDYFRKKFQKMEEGKGSESAMLKLIRKDGTKALIEFTALPVEYESKKAILTIGQNITPWKETEVALRESEQKLKSLFDCSPDYYFITDLNLNIKFFNRLLPYHNIEDLLSQSMLEFFSHDYHDIAIKGFEQVKKTNQTAGFEISLSKGDVTNWYSCRIAALMFGNNQEGFIIVLTDITQQKESEIKLIESEQRYISLFDNINSGVIILQPVEPADEFIISDINKAALKIFKRNKNSVKGIFLDEFFTGYKKTGIKEKINTVRRNGKPKFIPAYYYHNRQFEGWLEHYIYRISGGEIIIVIEDITEKYLAAIELNKARKEWQDIFEAIGQPTFILDKKHNIIAANKSVIKLTGKSQEELKKQKCFEIFHLKKGQAADGCPMEKLLRSKDAQTREMEVDALSGTYMVSCTPIVDSEGEINKIIHIATDITDIKKAKEDLSSSLKRYQNLLDTIPYGVDEINADGTILLTNPAHAKMLGCKSEDLIGRNIFELQTTEEDREYTYNYFRKIKEEHPDPTPFFGKNNTCDGKVIDVQVDWNYLEGSDRKLLGFITVISNITERIKFEKALNDARLKAEESDRLKSAFLTNMSHEIRTPLNGIIGFSAMLGEESLTTEKRKTYINYIHKGTSQLLTLISDIIDISKIEADQISFVPKAFDLNNILLELKDHFENEIEKSNKQQLKLIFSKPMQYDKFIIYTDEVKLRQVLANLLSNAVKFTEKGIIEFGYEKADKTTLQFYVKDTGIGIAKENQTVIFERFRQEDDSFEREFAGAGLGLAISKGILEKLGGKIWVKSEKNKGSVFYFNIPCQTSEAKQKAEPGKSIKFKWDKRKILVVEDDSLNADLIKITLRPTKAMLIYAKDGEEAIDLFGKNIDIDLVLLDIRLPYLDGYSVAKHMKKLRPEIPILAYSAYAMDKEKSKAGDAGIDRYLTKPSRPGEILDAIGALFDSQTP
jgi:PAS domain S-box-containing protein